MKLLHKKGLIVYSFPFTVAKTIELSENIRNYIIKKNKNSKGYKTIAKDLEMSTVHYPIKTFHCHKTLPG